MNTEQFLRLRAIFDEAVLLDPAAREHYVRHAAVGDNEVLEKALELIRAQGEFSPPSISPELDHPKAVGAYRILRTIGKGGMGTVFLAVRDDGAFHKRVAVKLLREFHAGLVHRFHQERQVLASLDHPNIARIIDGGQTEQGQPYYVMDYIDGANLDAFADASKLNLTGRIQLFQQVARAVQYLHENKVVHRDLKPPNILVTPQGVVKLLDFGIAKVETPFESLHLTEAYGRPMTPVWASPEQISGAPITAASDIYTLGLIVYQLLTGSVPHADPNAKLTVDPPLPSANIRQDLQRTQETTAQLRRRIAGDLDHIVLRCLSRNVEHRYASAADLADDLQRFLDGLPVLARPIPFPARAYRFVKRHRLPVAAAALLFLLSAFGAWQAVQAQIQGRRAEASEAEISRLLDTLNRTSASSSATSTAERLRDLQRFRKAFETDYATAWSARPGLSLERRQLLDRGTQYLDSLRPYATQDRRLAAELANAYQQVGLLYEVGPRELALRVYGTAALMINTAANGNVNDEYRGQYLFLVGRIRRLGGSVPVFMPMRRSEPQPSQPSYNHPAPAAAPKPAVTESPSPVSSVPATKATAAIDEATYGRISARLVSVAAKVRIAEETFEQIRADSARLGQTPHPDISTANTRMKIALEVAKKELQADNVTAAEENLGIADASANRVLKAGGR